MRLVNAQDPIFATFSLGRHSMPGIWRYMLPEELAWLKPPAERLATCNSCLMVTEGEYRANCQCCTYFPEIPNFMLGLALLDPNANPHAVATLDALLAAGHVLPQGLVASPGRFGRAVEAYALEQFGREPALLCPMADATSLACSIYPYRNSVCSTFFCNNDHGDAGESYWGAVQDWVGCVEVTLAQWVMSTLGIDAAAYHAGLNSFASRIDEVFEPTDNAWSHTVRQQLWGSWFGREREFLQEAGTLAMQHRAALYELALQQNRHVSLDFERGVRNWVPEAYRSQVPKVADAPGQASSVDELWYKVQLMTRRLWELPLGEGQVALCSGAQIVPNTPRPGRANKSYRVVYAGLPLFVNDQEADVLRLFVTAQTLGEATLELPQLQALEDARGFLAQCLRLGVLARC